MNNQTQNFIKEFSEQRKRFRPWAILVILCTLAIIVVVPILFFLIEITQQFIAVYFTIVIIPLVFGFYKTVQFTKCPSCKKYMGRDILKFCPICGVQIQN